jgi:hypothetical protein
MLAFSGGGGFFEEDMTMADDVRLESSGPQAQWDETWAKLGRTAPQPRAGEGDADYLRRMARLGREYIPSGEEIARVKFDSSMPDAVVPKFSEMMRSRVEANLRRVDNLDKNDPNYKVIHVADGNTGMRIREFYRARPFTDDFGVRCRRVSRINAPASMPLYAVDKSAMAGIYGR